MSYKEIYKLVSTLGFKDLEYIVTYLKDNYKGHYDYSGAVKSLMDKDVPRHESNDKVEYHSYGIRWFHGRIYFTIYELIYKAKLLFRRIRYEKDIR